MNSQAKYEQMLKQITDFQESFWKTSMNAMVIYQNRIQKYMTQMWEQNVWASEKMETVMSDWKSLYGMESARNPVPVKSKRDLE